MIKKFERITVEDTDNGITIVTFNDKKLLGEIVAQEIGDALSSLVEKQGRNKILCNWKNVEFLDHYMLGNLVMLRRIIQAVCGKLVFCSLSNEVREVFEITRLDELFTMVADEQIALLFLVA